MKNVSSITILFLVLLSYGTIQARSLYPWKGKKKLKIQNRLDRRISPPSGFRRIKSHRGSFLSWMRGLPLKSVGTPVRYYNGSKKTQQNYHVAVVDIDVGRRNLQQCADAVMRIWGEYLWSKGLQKYCRFSLLNGMSNPWWRWARGYRLNIKKGRVRGWQKRSSTNYSYKNYRRYLWNVMMWSNTTSMTRQLQKISRSKVRGGDILLVGWKNGSPGHSIMLLDEVRNKDGQRLFLLGQSYMPAQSFHILKAPHQRYSPWYSFPKKGRIITPEWTFTTTQFYRLPHRKR